MEQVVYRLIFIGIGLLIGYVLPWRLFDDSEHRLAWSPKILLLPFSIPLLPFVIAFRCRRTHPAQARLLYWLFGILYVLSALIIPLLLASD